MATGFIRARTGREKQQIAADSIVLTLLHEIATARTFHHADRARDAIFHIRLMSKQLEEEAAYHDSEHEASGVEGSPEQEKPSGE